MKLPRVATFNAGPGNLSSIEDMTEFQLDVNDFDDIIGAVKKTRLPAYIFHCQVVHEYSPPTRCSKAEKMWFADIWALKASQKETRQRQGENKKAGYYKTEAFKPIALFLEELKARRYEDLKRRIDDLA